jgi:HEAT repeat protein
MRPLAREITFEAALADLKSDKWQARARAAGALGTCDPADRDPAATALRPMLGDPHGAVRHAAALSLAELRDAQSVPALIAQLEDRDERAGEAAAIALGWIGDARAWEPLAQALREGPPPVRYQAVESLVELDAARAAPLLVLAAADLDPEVRGNVAEALGEAPDDPAARNALVGLLADTAPAPRFAAACVLATRGDRRATGALLHFLGDRDRALDAVTALATLGDSEARAPLRVLLRRFFAPALVKVRAAHALERLGDPDGRAYLERASRSRREDVRGLAEELLHGRDGTG